MHKLRSIYILVFSHIIFRALTANSANPPELDLLLALFPSYKMMLLILIQDYTFMACTPCEALGRDACAQIAEFEVDWLPRAALQRTRSCHVADCYSRLQPESIQIRFRV